MSTRFDRITGVKPAKAPKQKLPKTAPSFDDSPPLPNAVVSDFRSVAEKVAAGVFDPATYMKWPGHKPSDPDVMREKKRYRALEEKLLSQFKRELFAEFNVANHPKRELCYDLAWSEGHSSGLHEVVMYFERFSELLQP